MSKKAKISFVALMVLFVTILVMVVARPYRVSGDCMEPAIIDGKLYFLNKLAPYVRLYKMGDIILFNHENRVWISRIVALESDTIHIKKDRILVNDIVLEDSVDRNWSNWKYGRYAIVKPFLVPKDHVYVLSDNLSAHHDDSRVFGPIHNSSILGLVW